MQVYYLFSLCSMFTTGIRRWAAFSRSMREFSSLRRQDQAQILQAAVMQLSILRAVASFQMVLYRSTVLRVIDSFYAYK